MRTSNRTSGDTTRNMQPYFLIPYLPTAGKFVYLSLVTDAYSRKIVGWHVWAAAGFEDTLLRWNPKPEVGHGNETAVQPGVQA